MIRKYSAFIIPVLLMYSCTCNQADKRKIPVPEIAKDRLPQVEVVVHRYEEALFRIDEERLQDELKRLQPEFTLFLDGDLDDKQNIRQMRDYLLDPVIREHFEATMSRYPELSGIQKELSSALSHYLYHFPEQKVPKIYTYVSGGDFEDPVKNVDSALVIALDVYLGKDFHYYSAYRIPNYKTRYMDSSYIVRDCMEELAIALCGNDGKARTLLDQMISMGKVMYVLDLTLPRVHDTIKIKYPKDKLDWCHTHEGNIWAFLIENKLLYSQKGDDLKKFFGDGPFTSAFGKESPPRIAVWVGWQIIRSFMTEMQGLEIQKLMEEQDSQKILFASKYKPKKKK
jgi:hypothetical protein